MILKLPIYILRIYLGISYPLRNLIFELTYGLNISLRNKSYGITLQGTHGYALIARSALINILKAIDIKGKNFLDIESGKGECIIYARKSGCMNSFGIEYEKNLHNITSLNIYILKMSLNLISRKFNALNFKNYIDYNIPLVKSF